MLRFNLLLLLLKASEMSAQSTGPDAMRHLSKISVSPVSAGLVTGPPLDVGSLWKDKPTLLYVSDTFQLLLLLASI
jgi:hypothetical protein